MNPFRTADDHDTAIGWISFTELFLLLGILLMVVAALAQSRATEDGGEVIVLRTEVERLKKELREAEQRASEAELRAAAMEKERDEALALAARYRRDQLAARAAIPSLEEYVAAEAGGRAAADRRAETLFVTLQKAGADLDAAEAAVELARKQRDEADGKRTAAEKARDDLADKLLVLRRDRDDLAKKADLAAKGRDTTVVSLRAAEKARDDLADKLLVLRRDRDDLAKKADLAAKDRVAAEAAAARVTKDRDGLAARLEALTNRFEGLELEGEHVVFLIDTSGSMVRQTKRGEEDPEKWRLVCEVVRRVMRSLTRLKSYQVVTFAEKVALPIPGPPDLRPYAGAATADEVRDTLLKLRPEGGTNLHAGFERAFEYRRQGADTIFLLSDGLPSIGENLLSANERADISQRSGDDAELRLGVLLARHLRQTISTRWNAPEAGRPRVRVQSVGFYFENPDIGAFLWALSRENGGGFVGMSRP